MIEIIKEQLTHTYEGDPWYGSSIKAGLESIDPAGVFHSPGVGMHSIAELVAHMISWREFAERRLRGDNNYLPEKEKTFDWKVFSSQKEHAWNILTERLNSNQQNLLTLLNQNDDSLLAQKVAGKPYSYCYLLSGLIQHDIYHLGQIMYINNLLNKKNSEFKEIGFLKYSYKIFPYENLIQNK